MIYNVYIKTQSSSINIFNIEQDDLEIIISAYNQGDNEFYIAGKKYWLRNLFEIKIFTSELGEKFEDFINSAEMQGLFVKNFYSGGLYLPPEVLVKMGKDVTRDFIKGGYGSKSGKSELPSLKNSISIFISHSGSDINIVKLVINILRKSLNLPSDQIRCTSVPGYKLPSGSETDSQLKQEIFSAKVFIGIITKQSIHSTYVLFELGARWGVNLPLIPFICDKLGTSLLDGPIKNINALSATEISDIHQFLYDIGSHLGKEPENPSSYTEEILQLNKTILENSDSSIGSEEEIDIVSEEFNEAEYLIKQQSEIEWADDYEMRMHYIESQMAALDKLKKLKPEDLTETEFKRIRDRAVREWPLDFEMRLNEEEKQIESLRKFKKIK